MNRFTYGLRSPNRSSLSSRPCFCFSHRDDYSDTQGDIHIVPLSEEISDSTRLSARRRGRNYQNPRRRPKKDGEESPAAAELYDTALALYLEVIERDTKAEYAQRVHYQIAKIYKRRYDWDNATKHYQAIVALDPTGYYANEAKSGYGEYSQKTVKLLKQSRLNTKTIRLFMMIHRQMRPLMWLQKHFMKSHGLMKV